MPKFKHCVKNYIKLPFVLIVNPFFYLVLTVINAFQTAMSNLSDYLPKLDIDWSEDIEKQKDKTLKEYFKLTQKENN